MRTEAAKWQGVRPLPLYIFQKVRTTSWLFAPLFFLDGFLQNPLLKNGGFCREASFFSAHFQSDTAIFVIFRKKGRKNFCFDGKRPRCRSPPSNLPSRKIRLEDT